MPGAFMGLIGSDAAPETENVEIIPVARSPVAKKSREGLSLHERKVNSANGDPLQGFRLIHGEFSLPGCGQRA